MQHVLPCCLQIYSFVARAGDNAVLSEYSAYSGNFHSVAQEVLGSMARLEERFTIAADRHTFNFLTHNGYSECRSTQPCLLTQQHSSYDCARSWPIMPPVTTAADAPCGMPSLQHC